MNQRIRRTRRSASAVVLVISALVLALACAGSGGSANGPGPRSAEAKAPPSYDSISIRVLRRMGDGKQSEAAKIDKRLAELEAVPVSFVVKRAGGQEGAPVSYEARLEVGAEKTSLPKQSWSCASPAACLHKEWLRFELRGAAAPRVVERVLYERGQDEDVPLPGYRRSTITVLTGEVSRADVMQRVQQERARLRIEERQKKAEKIVNDAKGPEALAELDALDIGAPLGHLVALTFAAESDVLTARLAATLGVGARRETPRILITTLESDADGGNDTISLDLRLDEVRAEASDPAVARYFQLARGLEESALEGRLLEKLSGEGNGVSTARLMQEAGRQGVELVVLSRAARKQIASLGAPPRFAALLTAAVDQGNDVIVPKSAVDFAGRQRWGFWQVQPETGMTIGVMEGGQHQGMTDFTKTTQKVALDPNKGFIIGFEAGAIQSHFAFAGLLFKHGEATPELIAELEAMFKNAACTYCQKAEATADVSLKVGEDCFKKGLNSIKSTIEDVKDPGKGGNAFQDAQAFCEAYENGFKCAVGILVASLKGKDPLPVKVEPEAKIQVGCAEVKVGGG